MHVSFSITKPAEVRRFILDYVRRRAEHCIEPETWGSLPTREEIGRIMIDYGTPQDKVDEALGSLLAARSIGVIEGKYLADNDPRYSEEFLAALVLSDPGSFLLPGGIDPEMDRLLAALAGASGPTRFMRERAAATSTKPYGRQLYSRPSHLAPARIA